MARPPMPLGSYNKITVRADGDRWRAQAYFRGMDGRTRRVSKWGASAARAKRALIEELTNRASATESVTGLKPNTRFRAAAEMWLDDVRRQRKSSTFYDYRERLDCWVLPALGDLMLREVTVPVIDGLMATYETRGHSVSTRQAIRSAIGGVLGLAVRHGALKTNPTRDLGRLEGRPKSAVRALTAAERADLLAKLDADKQAVRRDLPSLVRFMIGTGCRIGEALAVRWCDVDLEGQKVVVADGEDGGWIVVYPLSINGNIVPVRRGEGMVRNSGKTAAANRTVALPMFLVTMLQVRRDLDAAPDEPIFPNSYMAWRDPDTVGKWLRQARAKAGYPWLTSHVFRKTAATILDEQKLSAREIADHLGHTRPSMTQDVYMHRGGVSPAGAAALDEALRVHD